MKRQLNYVGKYLVWFTSIFTCVVIASTIFVGLYSNPYLPLGLVVQAAMIAAVASLLNFIYYSEQPISRESMVLRTAVHFSLLLAMVTGCALHFSWFSWGNTGAIWSYGGLFVVVYVIIWMANFIGDIKDERIMNLRLVDYRDARRN